MSSVRSCACCNNIISGHPNKKFCNAKCKDKHHNAKPHRINRTRNIVGIKNPLLSMIQRSQSRFSIEIDPHDAADELSAKAECFASGCMGCPDCMDWDEDDF